MFENVNTVQSNLFSTDTMQRDRTKCPLYRGVRIIGVGNVGFLAFLGPNELSVIERCSHYRGVRTERFDCIQTKKVRLPVTLGCVAISTYRFSRLISNISLKN